VNAGAGAAAHFQRAVAMMNQGRWPEALAAYEAVLRLEPGHVPTLNNRGIVLERLGRQAEALASYEEALSLAPGDPLALNNRGEALQKLMRHEEALASFDAAIASAPDFAEAHGNRGRLLGHLGRTAEAIQALERAIELAPSQPQHYLHLAPLRRFGPGDPVLERMQRLAAQPRGLSAEGRIELGFALAKALADTGEHEEAFAQLSLANRLKRSTFHYDEPASLRELERIGALLGQDFQARMQGAGDPGPAPILIVGMPRSGSTLVEQILASHPKVFAAGELPDLEEVIEAELQRAGVGPFPDGAAQLSPGAVSALGDAYVKRLCTASNGAERIVDKALSNFRFLGLVHVALPSARIVHMRRDPVDTCMSCYSLLFGGNQPFAYDLGELGRYHRAVDRLMRRWRELLPAEALLELNYETLIADPEAQVRRLLDHCGLDWDPRCLEFHRTRRVVTTSSAAQVRRPLYGGAVGAARVYERHLGPLLEALGEAPGGGPHATSGAEPGVVRGPDDQAGARRMTVTELERQAASGDIAAQRALAEALDAEGRHTDAIDWLARAGQAGDVEALTALGLRLVVGQNAPFLPTDGARLLGDAAGAGGARAMEHLAVLIGGGFYARQSWPMALDLLQRAADAGSPSAQAQLQLLAGDSRGDRSWTAVRQAIDLSAWTRAPAARTLSASPAIQAVENLIPPGVCDWIIGQCAGKMERAELYDPATGQHTPGTETRLNRIANFNLAETNLANLLVQAKMAAALGAPMPMLEPFAVLNYAPGEEYGEHVDYLDPAIPAYAAELAQRGQRVATCLIYLNDDYEGGETEFPTLGVSFRGRKGDALIFFSADMSGRPDPRTVHAGRTPTSGQKWLLSQFFRNRPVVGGESRRS
jgi:tetratricopeptide (TPR) repeat protein